MHKSVRSLVQIISVNLYFFGSEPHPKKVAISYDGHV